MFPWIYSSCLPCSCCLTCCRQMFKFFSIKWDTNFPFFGKRESMKYCLKKYVLRSTWSIKLRFFPLDNNAQLKWARNFEFTRRAHFPEPKKTEHLKVSATKFIDYVQAKEVPLTRVDYRRRLVCNIVGWWTIIKVFSCAFWESAKREVKVNTLKWTKLTALTENFLFHPLWTSASSDVMEESDVSPLRICWINRSVTWISYFRICTDLSSSCFRLFAFFSNRIVHKSTQILIAAFSLVINNNVDS